MVAKDGSVTLSINTNSETSSLKINGEEQGGDSTGKYENTRYAGAGMESFKIVVVIKKHSLKTVRQINR